MLQSIRKVKKHKNRFSVNSQNLLCTIFCDSTVSHPYIDNFREAEHQHAESSDPLDILLGACDTVGLYAASH